MALQESGEMYLETILILSQKLSSVRSVDIADHMGYSKPSVSRAVGILKKEEYISIDQNGFITLTDSGMYIAKKIYSRHQVISSFLLSLGVNEKIAVEDACKMEHDISDESFEAFKRFLKEPQKYLFAE